MSTVPVVVTGATGFVASHLIHKLLSQGQKVRGTVRSVSNADRIAKFRKCFDGLNQDNLELVEADLTKEDGWDAVMSGGVQHVYHVASPFPIDNPANEDVVVRPAVDGTLFALRACRKSGTVKKVVLTSSCVAVIDFALCKKGFKFDESNWAQTKDSYYTKSKVLAEKAAWDFVKSLPEEEKFELAVVNPSFILGAPLFSGAGSSSDFVRMLLEKEMPLLPKIHMYCVHIDTVVEAHIKAMHTPEASGHRHCLVSENLWVKEMAAIIQEEFKPMGYAVPQCQIPNILVKMTSPFDRRSAAIAASVGKEVYFDTSRMQNVLGVAPKSVKSAIIDMSYKLIDMGVVKKTPGYKPRST